MGALRPESTLPLSVVDARGAVRRLAAELMATPLLAQADGLALGAELGFDSVRLVELLLACERELGLPFDTTLLADPALSIEALAARVASRPR